MKVLLLNPPFKPEHGRFSREQRSPAITKSGTFYYPMWLAYATGVLEEAGFEAKLVDAPAKRINQDEILELASEFKPRLLVVDTSTPSIYDDIAVAEELKRLTGTLVVLVGTHPSALPEETLKISPYIDAVARHEYEYTVLELARLLESNGNGLSRQEWSGIQGISFRDGGRIHHNPDRELAADLDEFPFVSKVYKKHLDYRDYFYAHSKSPIVTIISGRGCPHQCVYCVYPQVFSSRRVRYRSVKNVADEIEYILNNFPGLREIMFEDDTLTINKKRVRELAEEITKRGLRFSWSANSRADLDLDTMMLLKKAGCRLLCVGIESGDQRVLDSMKKHLKVEQIKQFFKDAKKANIMIHGCFLLGNPGETKESLGKTLELAKELQPDTAQFFPLMVYPGTEAYSWAKKNGYLLTEDYRQWLTDDGLHNCVVSRPGLSNQELVEFCDRARQEFYLRPSYVAAKALQAIKDPWEFGRLAKGGRTLAKHIFRNTFKPK
jgi:radical SAM superfamily enzyme YgiQ (UPF0313 family)